MENITVTLNGGKVSVAPNATIMEAATRNGIEIPHLCHTPYLEPTSACRLCVVEVEGMRALVPSCSVKVADGMKIQTHSERVLRSRRSIIELLLSAHPLDCLTCDNSGDCALQDYAYEMGVSKSPYSWATRYNFSILDDNPFYIRDYNKCILCGRCVRTCAEVQGDNVIDFAHRGFDTMVSMPLNHTPQESDCVFCGNCVAACPVGALTEKDAAGKGRAWEFTRVRTICPYCGCGCRLVLNVKDNKIVKVTSDEDAPVNGIALCSKGRFGYGFVNSPDRLTTPMIRIDGELQPASWDEALNHAAWRLLDIKKSHGADSIAGLASAKCTNEENYLFQKFMRAVIGTNNVDHCARLCHASTVAGLAASFGSGAMTNTIADIGEADVILVTGSNTTETHPIIALEVKRAVRRGAKLIVVEPRSIQLCDMAEIHLRPRPGTDVAWLNGFMHVIIEEKLLDKEFIDARCEGFDELRKAVKKYTPEHAGKITGIPADDLRRAARIYAGAERATILYAMGITQHTSGTNNVLSIANLAMLTGNIGRPGTGVNPLRGQNNVQGACDMGCLPGVYTGYQPVSAQDVKEKFEQAWGVRLPEKPGLTVMEMMDAAISGGVRAMYIMGENPMVSDPDIEHVRKALDNLDFLIVQDIFLTETAMLADVVFPSVSFAEKDGTFTNTERRVQRVRKALSPIGDSRQDWDIIGRVAMRFGHDLIYSGPEEIIGEIASLTPSYGGIDYGRIEKEAIHWPCPAGNHPGTPILHTSQFTRGRGRFHAVEYRGPDETADSEYPFIMTTGRMLYHFHTGSMSRRSRQLDEHVHEAYIEINPEDAEKAGIADGRFCTVASRRGEIQVKAKVVDRTPEGIVFMPFHFAEAAANKLTNTALDPVAKIPELKVCAVRVSAT